MKKLLLALSIVFATALQITAQTIDEKIGNAMNTHDWFALDSIYNAAPKDSIHPFLEVFSRCLIGNRLNRTDISIPAFQELLNSQSLDMGNLVQSVHMFAMDLSREGKNAEASSMINSIVSQTRQYLDSTSIKSLTVAANRYASLAKYAPYRISFPDVRNAIIPFNIVPVGPKEKQSVLIHLRNSSINGSEADITFDTGAGTNMISHEMADKYGLIPLEGSMLTVSGIGKSDGYIAIAKELRLGDIIVKDVPFTVVTMSTNNKEANKYIDCFNIVVGSELMLQLKDLTVDFINRRILVPTVAPRRSNAKPNICFSSGMNLLSKGFIHGMHALMCIDSGDASFGSLGFNIYKRNREYVERTGRPDTIRSAGIGGVSIMPCYYVPDVPITIGGVTVIPSELVVKTRNDNAYDANIGLRTLMLFNRIHFNMVDFVLTTEPSLESMNMSRNKPAELRFSKDNGLNIWQIVGIIGIGITRRLLFPDAPDSPDI